MNELGNWKADDEATVYHPEGDINSPFEGTVVHDAGGHPVCVMVRDPLMGEALITLRTRLVEASPDLFNLVLRSLDLVESEYATGEPEDPRPGWGDCPDMDRLLLDLRNAVEYLKGESDCPMPYAWMWDRITEMIGQTDLNGAVNVLVADATVNGGAGGRTYSIRADDGHAWEVTAHRMNGPTMAERLNETEEVARELAEACKAFVAAWDKSLQLEKTDVALRMARSAIDKADKVFPAPEDER